MKRLGSLAVLAGVIALVLSPVPAQAAPGGKPGAGGGGGGGTFSCRASALRVELLGLTVEPFVANEPGNPCADDNAGVNATLALNVPNSRPTVTVDASALFANTEGDSQGFADSGLADVTIGLFGGAVKLSASILTSEATAGPCPSTSLASESTVADVSLKVLGLVKALVFANGVASVDLRLLGFGVLTVRLNEQIMGANQVTQRALRVSSDLLHANVVVAEAIADVHGDPCGGKPPRLRNGFMTGGGSIQATVGRVTHGAHLLCVATEGPNNLEVNWAGGRFHLESVTASSCGGSGSAAGNPTATFNTITGTGKGRCNGSPADATWKLVDNGEPGVNDRFEIQVSGGCTLNASGTLERGNHQAHSQV